MATKLNVTTLVKHLAAVTGAPPAAAHAAIAKVLTMHLAAPGSPAQQAATADLVNLASPAAQELAGAAHAAIVQSPAFWVTFYAGKAKSSPLAPSHPWAGIIARDLASI